MKLSLILEAINRAERPLDRYRRDVERAGGAASAAGSRVGGMGRHMDRAAREARELGRAGDTMGDKIAHGARRGARALIMLERRMQLSSATMTALAVKGAGILGGAIRSGVGAAGMVGGALATGGLYKIVSAGTQSEVLKTQLVQSRSGDVKASENDMKWIQDFAANTPYDLASVTKAFIDARGAGVDPMNGSLMALGDAASALGKTYEEAIGMIGDAVNNQFDRMAEFQIKTAQKNGVATFRYFDRSGKEIVRNVKMTGHNIEHAITAILKDKFGGGMEAIAKTTSGKWDNLTDKLSQGAVKVWNSGFGAAVQKQLDRATKAFDAAEKDGSSDRWAKSVGGAMGDVVTKMGEADWEGFGKDIRGIASAFGELYDLAGKAADKLSAVRKSMASIEVGADKYSGILGGIEYRNGGLDYHAPDWAKSKPAPAAKAPAKSSNDVPFFPADERPRPAAPARAVPPAAQKQAAPAKPQNAKIALHVTTDRGVSVRPTKIKADGADVELNTGRAMGAFA